MSSPPRPRQHTDTYEHAQVVLVAEPELPPDRTFLAERHLTGPDTLGPRLRERRFIFDHAFDGDATNLAVYRQTVQVGSQPVQCGDMVLLELSSGACLGRVLKSGGVGQAVVWWLECDKIWGAAFVKWCLMLVSV